MTYLTVNARGKTFQRMEEIPAIFGVREPRHPETVSGKTGYLCRSTPPPPRNRETSRETSHGTPRYMPWYNVRGMRGTLREESSRTIRWQSLPDADNSDTAAETKCQNSHRQVDRTREE